MPVKAKCGLIHWAIPANPDLSFIEIEIGKINDLIHPGEHGTTFGGNPLACAVGSKVMEIVADDAFLDAVNRKAGLLRQKLEGLVASHPDVFDAVRGSGLMLGLKCKVPNTDVVKAGYGEQILTVPAADNVIRLLPPLTITEDEIALVTDFLREQRPPEYDESVVEAPSEDKEELSEEDYDERYDDAVALVTQQGQASISMIQRKLRVGYNRAARMIEAMEKQGIVGPSDGVRPREVFRRTEE